MSTRSLRAKIQQKLAFLIEELNKPEIEIVVNDNGCESQHYAEDFECESEWEFQKHWESCDENSCCECCEVVGDENDSCSCEEDFEDEGVSEDDSDCECGQDEEDEADVSDASEATFALSESEEEEDSNEEYDGEHDAEYQLNEAEEEGALNPLAVSELETRVTGLQEELRQLKEELTKAKEDLVDCNAGIIELDERLENWESDYYGFTFGDMIWAGIDFLGCFFVLFSILVLYFF
ncbi:hypothetical protein L596_016193 [Steinernema carpocapsae]|uniref:Uncharacterized protein n=1 Tax=Steinernema carpocapsae TaxID=34508 RepID=A0A4U5NIC7_STECR|nr:hypothetical protein L596_016193 [Steinernema carpocapsae]